MIPDKLFKTLDHSYQNFVKLSDGQEIEPGYRPDYVLQKGGQFIILESENTSSRKTYVGGMIKAAHYLRKSKKGKLVFVLVPKTNTKILSIANHLKPYFQWIQELTNLEAVYVIEANNYYNNKKVLAIDSSEFYSFAIKV